MVCDLGPVGVCDLGQVGALGWPCSVVGPACVACGVAEGDLESKEETISIGLVSKWLRILLVKKELETD